MAKPSTLPLTNLKRNWKFLWLLEQNSSSNLGYLIDQGKAIYENARSAVSNIGTNVKKIKTDVGNLFSGGFGGLVGNLEQLKGDIESLVQLNDPVIAIYVSQLAKSVDLPNDEVEYEYVQVGNVDYPVPVKYKMNPITVTYYDDNLDTVYNYHKTWLNLARTGNKGGSNMMTSGSNRSGMAGMTMNPVQPFCLSGKYITYENSLSMTEYALFLQWLNRGMSGLTSVTEKISSFFNLPDISEAGEAVDPFLKWHSTQTFSQIIPQTISRSTADKGGETLSEVTVTYIRVPKFKNRPKAYMGANHFGLDSNS